MRRVEPSLVAAGLVGFAVGSWLVLAARVRFEGLTFGWGVLAYLPAPYWVGLLAAISSFFLFRHQPGRWIAALVVGLFTIGTLGPLFEFGLYHDSWVNAEAFVLQPHAQDAGSVYSESFPGLSILNSILLASGAESQEIARFFPLLALALYTGGSAAIGTFWSQAGLLPRDGGPWILLFLVLFGPLFALRINDAPQTLAFILYIYLVALLPAVGSLALSAVGVALMAFLAVTHPISSVLTAPAIIAMIAMPRTRAVNFNRLLLLGSMSAAWLAYQADWSIVAAVDLAASMFSSERLQPFRDVSDFSGAEGFVSWVWANRIVRIVLFALLATGFVLLNSRSLQLVTGIWLAVLAPTVVVALGAPTFADRGLLFASVPAAAVFAASMIGVSTWRPGRGWQSVRVAGVASLAVAAAFCANFNGAAFDHATRAEVQAMQHAAALDGPAFSGGFMIPQTSNRVTAIERGFLPQPPLTTPTVIVSPHVENAVRLRQGDQSSGSYAAFLEALALTHRVVYDAGDTEVWVVR